MLEHLLTAFSGCAGIWRPGARFAAPDADAESIIAELGERPLDLLVRAGCDHRLEVRAIGLSPCIVQEGVLACSAADGDVVVTWADACTLVGMLPDEGSVALSALDGTPCPRRGAVTIADDERGPLALAVCGPLFALACGSDAGTARTRALAGVGSQPWQLAEAHLALATGQPLAERRDL